VVIVGKDSPVSFKEFLCSLEIMLLEMTGSAEDKEQSVFDI
jgi:hypothetical protein